jgi:hypothetical protein
VVVWYHWAFLSISLVMLGLGVPGVVFCFVQQPQRYLRGLLIAAGVATPLAVALVVQLGASVIHFSVLLVIACVLPVTLTLGGAVCLLLMKAPGERVSRMYGADLLGAGLGAAAVIPMMHLVPTPDLAAAMGACPLLALVLQSEGRSRTPWILLAALGLLCLWEGPFEVTRTKNYDEGWLRLGRRRAVRVRGGQAVLDRAGRRRGHSHHPLRRRLRRTRLPRLRRHHRGLPAHTPAQGGDHRHGRRARHPVGPQGRRRFGRRHRTERGHGGNRVQPLSRILR